MTQGVCTAHTGFWIGMIVPIVATKSMLFGEYMTYMLWMMTDMKQPLPDNVKIALEYHMKKYGAPPNILEYSDKLSSFPNVDGVESTPISVPTNILLVGVKK